MVPDTDATPSAAQLRSRASDLRRFATQIEASQLRALAGLAGDATWYGPTAGAFLADCRTVDRLVEEATDGLRRAATRLDHEAQEVERAQLSARAFLGG